MKQYNGSIFKEPDAWGFVSDDDIQMFKADTLPELCELMQIDTETALDLMLPSDYMEFFE